MFDIRRREFITLLGGAPAAWPIAARAQQQPAKTARIGYLGFGTAAASAPRVEALRVGLRELGYIEGKNIHIEFRWAERIELLHELAGELARSSVDIIFADSSTEVEPARQATKTIPIVFATHADPVGLGHVASLARPGGNATGMATVQPDLATKRLAIFKEALPHATRFGVLWSATAPSYLSVLQAVEPASQKLGVQLQMIPVAAAEDFEGALATMARERSDGVFVVQSSLMGRSHPALLAELALKYRLPTIHGSRENVVAGGLMSYAPDHVDLTRRAATYIDKILKGIKPADLPVEQASKYQLVINLKTAKALGLDLPWQLQQLADEVIE
jgi:putative tryptophan/tyrosine transport system substrate-binding protein